MAGNRGRGRGRGKKSRAEDGEQQHDGSEEKKEVKKQKIVAPTVGEIITDPLTHLSLEYWAPLSTEQAKEQGIKRQSYEPKIVENVYNTEMKEYKLNRIMMLEVSHYLENYLWKNYQPKKSSKAHLISILMMVNEKFREDVNAWDCFHTREDVFPNFFAEVLELRKSKDLSMTERTHFIVFLINSFQSLEDPMIRKECMRLVSLPMWTTLNPQKLKNELAAFSKMEKQWNAMKKQEKEGKSKVTENEKSFLPNFINDYLGILDTINQQNVDKAKIKCCERFIELMLDLISQLPTRRFFRAVLQDKHVVVKSQMSALFTLPDGRLFTQLVEMLRFYEGFEIDEYTGKALSEDEMAIKQTTQIRLLQRIAYHHFQPELKLLALSNIASLQTRDGILEHLKYLSTPQLRELCTHLGLLPKSEGKVTESREFLQEIVIHYCERRLSQLEAISEMPIYPTEQIIWNDNLIPSDEYTGEHCLALPKV